MYGFVANSRGFPRSVNTSNPTVQALFTELKQASREFLALIRLSPLLSNGPASSTLSPLLARRLDMIVARKEIQDAGLLADFMANAVDCTTEEKLRILSALSVKDRLEMVNEIIKRQIAGFQSKTRIMTFTTTTTNPASGLDVDRLRMLQQEAILRRTGSSFPSGFSGFPPGSPGSGGQGGEEEPSEVEELKKKLSDANLSVEAQQVAKRELRRLQKMNPVQAEYQVCRNYLETLADIPWTKVTADKLGGDTLERARKQLDDDHYGLRKIKKRLLEYLAVLKLKQAVNVNLQAKIQHLRDQAKKAEEQSSQTERQTSFNESPESLGRGDAEQKILDTKRMVEKSPILLLVGPPGTGKTSLAKSIATALGRKFHRISLGGVRDEAEIRGHRRTYVAAMPGLIVNGLKKVGVANPVFLLDELDKVGTSNFHGDPSAAMLEVLDPEQNHTFTDHYVNIPIDLSKVLFIATANTLETIPPPLLDRLETIHLSGYTTLEKKHIATRHLIPKQITTNGLETDALKLQPDALDQVITAYTREAGVRSLEREIGAICRYKAVEYSSALDSSTPEKYNSLVTLSDLESILGQERYEEELAAQSSRPGVVTGLVAYSSGGQGSILFVEVTDFPSSGPSSSSATRITLTGKLGDVLKESVEVALTWVRAHAFSLGIATDPNEDILKARGVHVHCPAGAVPKDGPSAGLAHAVALVSLFSGRSVPPQIAMTGEVSLRGKVTPVGGIAEKLIGALRAGVRTVLLPAGNRKDVKDLPAEVREGLDIVHVQ